uniref:Uncharacterized protein n=2 Tax=Phlebotomus papatasi TaxID=29031 RepID=A0A1B0DJK8_PHLPP
MCAICDCFCATDEDEEEREPVFSEDNATMTDADVVYRCPIILEPRDGLSIRVLGEILPTCER